MARQHPNSAGQRWQPRHGGGPHFHPALLHSPSVKSSLASLAPRPARAVTLVADPATPELEHEVTHARTEGAAAGVGVGAFPPPGRKHQQGILKRTRSLPSYNHPSNALPKSISFSAKLEKVCVFQTSESPKTIPSSEVYSVQDTGDLDASSMSRTLARSPTWTLVSRGAQHHTPSGGTPAVQLDECRVDAAGQCLEITVLVRNLAYEKEVVVVYTSDDWATATHRRAGFHSTLTPSQGEFPGIDRFSVKLNLSDEFRDVPAGDIHFAIQYRCCGQVFWDNNQATNFQVSVERPLRCLSPERTFSIPRALEGGGGGDVFHLDAEWDEDVVAGSMSSLSLSLPRTKPRSISWPSRGMGPGPWGPGSGMLAAGAAPSPASSSSNSNGEPRVAPSAGNPTATTPSTSSTANTARAVALQAGASALCLPLHAIRSAASGSDPDPSTPGSGTPMVTTSPMPLTLGTGRFPGRRPSPVPVPRGPSSLSITAIATIATAATSPSSTSNLPSAYLHPYLYERPLYASGDERYLPRGGAYLALGTGLSRTPTVSPLLMGTMRHHAPGPSALSPSPTALLTAASSPTTSPISHSPPVLAK